MERTRAHVLIAGRVQGVCFRMYTEEEALNRRLRGWVKNLPDGRVEAVFEGVKKDVEEMIAWCHKGPSSARVTSVQVSREPCQDDFRDFRIIY